MIIRRVITKQMKQSAKERACLFVALYHIAVEGKIMAMFGDSPEDKVKQEVYNALRSASYTAHEQGFKFGEFMSLVLDTVRVFYEYNNSEDEA